MRRTVKGPHNADLLEGRYANYFEIGNNAFEFLLDFGQTYCDEPGSKMHSRIIVNPLYAKMLLEVLQQSVAQYEQMFGRVATEAGAEGDEPPPGTQIQRPHSIKLVRPR
jgi:hypothetical protein